MTRFRRTFALTVAVLVIFVGIFVALGYGQGPKLAGAQIDRAGVVERSGQQLRLFANQQVAAVKRAQVSVMPEAGVSVTTSGDVIAVQFTEPLRYNTTYNVRVRGVTSVYADQPETFSYEFRTGSPTVYYLDRGVATDRILATRIGSSDRRVVYEGAAVQEFAVFAGAIAVASINDDGSNALSLVNADGNVEDVSLPGPGSIGQLRANAVTNVLGFTFTGTGPVSGREYAETLITIDLAAGRRLDTVTGLDGDALAAVNWRFVPSSQNLVVQNLDESVLLVDTTTSTVVAPLGQFAGLDSVSTDGATLVVTDAFGPLALSIADGAASRIEPTAVEGVVPFGGPALALAGGGWVQQIVEVDGASGRSRTSVVLDDGSASRLLFRTLNDQGSIIGFEVSPNGQFLAIETVPNVSTGVSDGYIRNGRSTTITTVFVDMSSGAAVKSVEGFGVSW